MIGELSVLNCRDGDIRIKFDGDSEVDVVKAKRMIVDMLKRGYIIAVEHEGKLKVVKEFDATTCEYVIVENALYSGDPPADPDTTIETPEFVPKKRGRPTKTKLPMKGTKATAVPPTGGG